MRHIENLVKQCDEFKKEQLKKSKEQIYNNFYEIRFYEELKEYFKSYLNEEYTQEEIEELENSLRNRSMAELLDDFKSFEYSSLDNWELIREFIEME